MIQVVVFVPESHKQQVKQAMFDVGGGKIGNYDSCCFEYAGTGQFRALSGSQPFVGKLNEIETVAEIKIELTCEDHLYPAVVEAIRSSHPYETPAFYGIKTLGLEA
jgi:hypothetical protein